MKNYNSPGMVVYEIIDVNECYLWEHAINYNAHNLKKRLWAVITYISTKDD
ncbi:hypothetical protein GCM10007171_22570 [Dickeya fangzhongdai]|nr:hypothetical protein GCM10007171_22570 [Dickeya fangzhongdai]